MRPKNPSGRRGFTLIEVMVSMVVLLVLLGLVATIFNDATKAWDIGTRRAENNGSGRAVIDLIARDLSSIIADEDMKFAIMDNLGQRVYGGEKSDILLFVTLRDSSVRPGVRSADEVAYYMFPMADYEDKDRVDHRYRLVRVARPADASYTTPAWWSKKPTELFPTKIEDYANVTVIENVAAFEVAAPSLDGDYELPEYFEVYLELLDENYADTAQMMHESDGFSDQEREDFLEKNVRRYSARIFPNNREGYSLPRP